MYVNELSPGRTWLIRLDTDGELYEGLKTAAVELGVQAATLTVFGAVRNAVLRYYDQSAKDYRDHRIDEPLEVMGGIGNFSLRDGEPFLHCHVVLGDSIGRAYGGHLHETGPSIVFAAEVWMQELLGDPPVRLMDERCGLALWQ